MKWDEVESLIDKIVEENDLSNIDYIYGLPRGGMIPAVMLSHKTGISLLDNISPIELLYTPRKLLIIDDIYDTGKTLKPYLQVGYKVAVLVNNKSHKELYSAKQVDKWIVFPWETESSSKVDYKENEKEN